MSSLTKHEVGGASACVIAGRLAAADPGLKILVIEAGPPTKVELMLA